MAAVAKTGQGFKSNLRAHQHSVIARFGWHTLTGLNIQQLMEECAALVAANLGVSRCEILELLPDGEHFLLRAGVGWKPGQAGRLRLPADDSTQAGCALLNRQPALGEDRTRDTRFLPAGLRHNRDHNGLSELTVIIPGRHQPFGSLGVASPRNRSLRREDIHFLQAMANMLGLAIERDRAERDWRQSERMLDDFFENAPIGVHWLSPKGLILQANRAELRMLGYKAREYVGHPITEFHADPEAGRELLERLARKETLQGHEVGLRARDGSIKFVTIDADVLWQNGRFVFARCFTRDITDRRQREKQILEVSERERQRIGQDLHDQLCQYLTGIKFRGSRLESHLRKLGLPEAQDAREMVDLLGQSITQAHNLAHGLNPVEFDAHGLMAALRELAARMSRIFQRTCVCRIPRAVPIYDNTVAFHLYRITQEAIINAIKHGRARRILVTLLVQKGAIVLSIQDNGIGFPAKPRPGSGLGLHIMNYRAAMIGATISIQPRPEGGTVVTCTLPVPASRRNPTHYEPQSTAKFRNQKIQHPPGG